MTLNKKWLLSLLFVAFVSLLAACGNDEEGASDNKEQEKQEETEQAESGEQPEAPKPDLEGVPEVVASVNGTEIKKEEFETTYKGQFQQAAMQSQMTGQELDQDQLKKQVAESLVGQELLMQEADNREFTASEKEVNQTLEELAKQQQVGSADEFLAALEEQGMSEKEVKSQVKTQVKIDKLIAEEAGDVKPSEEEIKEAYDKMKEQQEKMDTEQEVPSYEEAKPTIEQQLTRQKEGQATQKLVDSLREEAEVTVNL
ncbi:peptidylprolyl isomerase [Halobacillus litoralis]|uniref:peptidylprolyl isomerase n=1 Tax=Halobacillus litoralis TaxID=45668 RepID=A0A845E8W9_9BACI|nr:SurA N-terminal domain-containing protein [Halobacillus litoralis]MYL50586.1 peptidylprolyl isomerase [Halobacillus litoralis]